MPTPLSLLAGETQEGQGAYGVVPTVPSPQETQAGALAGNVAQLGNIQAIAQALNQQSALGAQYPLTLNLPNYQQAMGQAMGNVQQYLGGEVPGDVWSQIQQMGAERGTMTGSPGSANANAAMLRALGLTSLGMQEKGLQNLTGLMGAVPRGTLFDPSALLVTPAQQQEWQNLANQLAAAPDPAEAAKAELEAIQAGAGAGQGMGGFGGGGGAGRALTAADMDWYNPSVDYANQWLNRQRDAISLTQEQEARNRAYMADPRSYANLIGGAGTTAARASAAGAGGGAGGTVIDEQGHEWVPLGNDTWMDLSAGDITQGMPSTTRDWTYEQPSGTSLTWTGQDMSGLFEDEQPEPQELYWPEGEMEPAPEEQYWPGPY